MSRYYKNISNTTKTFHGVTFEPGEIHEVVGCILHPKFIEVPASVAARTELPKADTTKRTTATTNTTKSSGKTTSSSDSTSAATSAESQQTSTSEK